MHNLPPPGFLAIHPPRRLWPSVPVFSHESLPPAAQHAQAQQRRDNPLPPRQVTLAG
jgi:hypothetical protein